MNLSTLRPAKGATKSRKRIGRGQGSGHGGTSTRGHKGAGSRSGTSTKPGFEGGQMPLKMRVPKFGFTNPNRVEYHGVNIDLIQQLVDQHNILVINIETLMDYGIVSNTKRPVKILGRGELKSKISVQAHAFTGSAKAAIEALGGTAETI